MEFLQRMRGGGGGGGGWLKIRRQDDLTAEIDSSSADGGEDIYNTKAEPEHLVIMVNGINGRYGCLFFFFSGSYIFLFDFHVYVCFVLLVVKK